MGSILLVKNINKSFNGVRVLSEVDFEIRAGEIHGLMGENGAGKSTLMKIIAGDYLYDSGEIMFEGNPVQLKKPLDSLMLGIRFIAQEFNLAKKLTVAENIFLGEYPVNKQGLVDWKRMNSQAEEILDRLGERIPVNKKVSELSIAEQQIVEIAKSMSKMPKILIMDEPTSALNDQETDRLFQMIQRLRDSGVSIIFITHRISEQFTLSDRITVMRDGTCVGTVNTSETNSNEIISMMIGHSMDQLFVHNVHKPGDILLETRDLCVNDKVKNINIEVRAGEIVTVFGLLGAGQKELCSALIGDVSIKCGKILISGKPVHFKSPKDACAVGIGLVSDDRKAEGLLPKMSVKENITISILRKISTAGIVNRIQEVKNANKWISRLNVKCSSSSQKIVSLSGGNQQKALIARWLSNNTKLLIMNLPTRGIDVGAKAEIYSLLDELCKEGLGVLLFSLEMPEVLGISDRIYVLCNGEITGTVAIDDATQETLMHYALCKFID